MLKLWRESDAVERALIVLFVVTGGPVVIAGALYYVALFLLYLGAVAPTLMHRWLG